MFSVDATDLCTLDSSLENVQNENIWEVPPILAYPLTTFYPNVYDFSHKYECEHPNETLYPVKAWIYNTKTNQIMPIAHDHLDDLNLTRDMRTDHKILCSMNYVEKTFERIVSKNVAVSPRPTDGEKQMHSTELDVNAMSPDLKSSFLCKCSNNSPSHNICSLTNINDHLLNPTITFDTIKKYEGDTQRSVFNKHVEIPQTLFCFNRKHNVFNNPVIRKSRKSTNLVKYKNVYNEPPLDKPINKFKILGKYKEAEEIAVKTVSEYESPMKHMNIQAKLFNTADKGLQNSLTVSEYDAIVEKLIISASDKFRTNNGSGERLNIETYLNQIVKELYDVKLQLSNVNHVKNVLRCLLEYWLSNTASENFKKINKNCKSIERQSNNYFTQDETTSNSFIAAITRTIQFNSISGLIKEKNGGDIEYNNKKYKLPSEANDSFEKERRIQELERILKNTVYLCETMRSGHNREEDIKITNKVIKSLDKVSHENSPEAPNARILFDSASSSNELPKIQETINLLISETSIPTDFAKEFLATYLGMLYGNENDLNSDSSTEEDQIDVFEPKCDIQAESTQKKVSISISAKNICNENINQNKRRLVDSGELYLRDVLDKITTVFTNNKTEMDAEVKNKAENNSNKLQEWTGLNNPRTSKVELGNIKTGNCNENSFSKDVSKYSLEHITMANDPTIIGNTSIQMLLKEKPSHAGEHKPINLNLKLAAKMSQSDIKIDTRKSLVDATDSDNFFDPISTDLFSLIKNTFIGIENYVNDDHITLNPYLSSIDSDKDIRTDNIELKTSLSDGTSNANRPETSLIDNDTKVYALINDENPRENDIIGPLNPIVEYPKPCYIISFKRDSLTSKLQSKREIKTYEESRLPEEEPSSSLPRHYQEDIPIFKKLPKLIDDKFILQLLENVCALSKDLPTLHKDIHSLYLKLRKKYEKIHMNCNKVKGVGLLGKIYCDDTNHKNTEENETQYDEHIFPVTIDNEVHTITNIKKYHDRKTTIDKAVGGFAITSKIVENYAQIDVDLNMKDNNIDASINNHFQVNTHACNTQTEPFLSLCSEKIIKKTIEKATSNQLSTRDYARSAKVAQKNVLDNICSENDRYWTSNFKDKPINTIDFKSSYPDLLFKKAKNVKKQIQSPEVRQELINEIKLLSPSFKVSTQSQMDNKRRWLKGKIGHKDYNVYQLVVDRNYEVKRSRSFENAAASSLKLESSDDLKTIFRCTSDPSYCSG